MGPKDGVSIVRTDWASEVRNVLQRIVGVSLEGDSHCLSAIAHRLSVELPEPANPIEFHLFRYQLAGFTDRLARAVHEEFHRQFVPEACLHRVPRESQDRWLDPNSPIEELLQEWSQGYRRWFEAHHQIPAALRARWLLDECFATPPTLEGLAQMVGTSRSTLVAQFSDAFAMGPGEYAMRARLREGLKRLRQSELPIHTVAAQVGYQSAGKFHARLKKYTALTPSEIRALHPLEFDQFLADRLSIRPRTSPRLKRRQPIRFSRVGDNK